MAKAKKNAKAKAGGKKKAGEGFSSKQALSSCARLLDISTQNFTLSRDAERWPSGCKGVVLLVLHEPWNKLEEHVTDYLEAFQIEELKKSSRAVNLFATSRGHVWIVGEPTASEGKEKKKIDSFTLSTFAKGRDWAGALIQQAQGLGLSQVLIHVIGKEGEALEGFFMGLRVAQYRFLDSVQSQKNFGLKIDVRGVDSKDGLMKGLKLGSAVNFARHLVNLPPNILIPQTMAELARDVAKKFPALKLTVWNKARLEKEKMGLHLAVGSASKNEPCLIHLSYRPRGAKAAPVAFVGKGITFDTGGLDIKPSSGMRLMKKDMGGSAALLGVAAWAASTGCTVPCDFYLAMAENSISGTAFRPSDVVRSRKGLTVEIHNTDAEGRLVLADALDVAVTAKEKPQCVIDVATLTGAIKVGLGAEIAGLFCNTPSLAEGLADSSRQVGEWVWSMPLYQKYRDQLNSNFADMVNCSDGFGGAITAALFLESFAGKIPWAHLDIYAWKDRADGCWLEAGGNGQMVAMLSHWLNQRSN